MKRMANRYFADEAVWFEKRKMLTSEQKCRYFADDSNLERGLWFLSHYNSVEVSFWLGHPRQALHAAVDSFGVRERSPLRHGEPGDPGVDDPRTLPPPAAVDLKVADSGVRWDVAGDCS